MFWISVCFCDGYLLDLLLLAGVDDAGYFTKKYYLSLRAFFQPTYYKQFISLVKYSPKGHVPLVSYPIYGQFVKPPTQHLALFVSENFHSYSATLPPGRHNSGQTLSSGCPCPPWCWLHSFHTVGWETKAQCFCPPYFKTWFFYVVFNAELNGTIRILCFCCAIIALL